MIIINARFLTQKVTGVQRFAIEISKQLRSLSADIIFVSPHNILDSSLAEQLDVQVIGKRTGLLWEQIDLRKYLKARQKPLLVNFCNTGILYYRQQIVTIHDMSYKVNPAWFSKKFYNWYNFLIPNIAANSRKIITVSNSSKNDITKYLKINAAKIDVVYNASYLINRESAFVTNKEKYILTISSLEPRKNLNSLIEAFKKINEDVKLMIVGLGNNKTFKQGIDESLLSDKVIIKGYVPDDELALLMEHAQAFAYVSLYEGFGLPLIEAMTMHCPVIASDIPVHKEVCGDAAIYVDPHDINDICAGIKKIINNNTLAASLVLSGNENIKRFSWHTSAEKTLSIINETLQGNS